MRISDEIKGCYYFVSIGSTLCVASVKLSTHYVCGELAVLVILYCNTYMNNTSY